MGTRRLVTWAAAGVAAAAVVVLGASPALATVVDSGHYTAAYSFSYDDCGFVVNVDGTASGHFRIREGKGKDATAFFVNDNFSYAETHTNPATGAFFTVTGNGVFNEVKATRVEGTIFEFAAVEAGQPFVLSDADGNVVVRDRGSLHHHALFDTEGDNVPGGVEIEHLGTDVHGPHFAFENDLCPLITELIG
jgi:hypothetical protein